ncbi:hypothetical protein [Dactylosporangium sp. NPDC048998]|uniref:hypothetical protein n=1 Tax=Dactylosporangium sp. NPDC048998 TaxID=3363976 RepID=UPI003724BD93
MADQALVIVQELPAGRHRSGQGWLAGLACLPVTVAAIAGPFAVLAAAGVWLARYSRTAAVVCVRAAFAELLIHILLVLIQLASGLATVRPDRHRARRWALGTFERVAEVTTLAANPGDRRPRPS